MSSRKPYEPTLTDEERGIAPPPPSLRDPVGRVRIMGMVEGISFLILLCFSVLKLIDTVSLPLSDIGRMGVRIVGITHGGLLMIFLLTLFMAWGSRALTGKQCGMAFIASLLPFGPFVIDRKLAVAESTTDEAEDAAD